MVTNMRKVNSIYMWETVDGQYSKMIVTKSTK